MSLLTLMRLINQTPGPNADVTDIGLIATQAVPDIAVLFYVLTARGTDRDPQSPRHTKLKAPRYLGVEVDGALEMAEQIGLTIYSGG
jgi:hypothetical protein